MDMRSRALYIKGSCQFQGWMWPAPVWLVCLHAHLYLTHGARLGPCLSTCLPACLSVALHVSACVCVSACLSDFLPPCLPIYSCRTYHSEVCLSQALPSRQLPVCRSVALPVALVRSRLVCGVPPSQSPSLPACKHIYVLHANLPSCLPVCRPAYVSSCLPVCLICISLYLCSCLHWYVCLCLLTEICTVTISISLTSCA